MNPMVKRVLGAAVVAVAVFFLAAGPAWAHAAYKASDPPDESTVSSPPSSVWAEFTEPVTMDSSLSITDPCGARVDNGDSRVTGARITVSMEGRAAGTYSVSFSVISAVDGHPTKGSFTFTSTGGDACPGIEEPSDDDEREPAPRADGSERDERPGEEGVTAAPDEPDEMGGGRGPGRRHRGDGGGGRVRDDGPREGQLAPLVAAPTQQPLPPVVEEPGVWDLPMDGFVAALMVAAAIGAVGGRVYSGIISPDA